MPSFTKPSAGESLLVALPGQPPAGPTARSSGLTSRAPQSPARRAAAPVPTPAPAVAVEGQRAGAVRPGVQFVRKGKPFALIAAAAPIRPKRQPQQRLRKAGKPRRYAAGEFDHLSEAEKRELLGRYLEGMYGRDSHLMQGSELDSVIEGMIHNWGSLDTALKAAGDWYQNEANQKNNHARGHGSRTPYYEKPVLPEPQAQPDHEMDLSAHGETLISRPKKAARRGRPLRYAADPHLDYVDHNGQMFLRHEGGGSFPIHPYWRTQQDRQPRESPEGPVNSVQVGHYLHNLATGLRDHQTTQLARLALAGDHEAMAILHDLHSEDNPDANSPGPLAFDLRQWADRLHAFRQASTHTPPDQRLPVHEWAANYEAQLPLHLPRLRPEAPQQMSRSRAPISPTATQPSPLRYGNKAPRGGFIARGIYYPGGRFLPAPLGQVKRQREQGHQPRAYSRKGPEMDRASGPWRYAAERPGERVANTEQEMREELARYWSAYNNGREFDDFALQANINEHGSLQKALDVWRGAYSDNANRRPGDRWHQGDPSILPEPHPTPEQEMDLSAHGETLISRPKRA